MPFFCLLKQFFNTLIIPLSLVIARVKQAICISVRLEKLLVLLAMTEVNHLGDLTPDPQNARKHNERNIGQIVSSLQEVGAGRSILIDENGVILAGNGVVEAAGIAGLENVKVVDADGDTIIAVRRKNLTAEQKRRIALWDNRAAELAEWDVDVLAASTELLDGIFSKTEQAILFQLEEDEVKQVEQEVCLQCGRPL